MTAGGPATAEPCCTTLLHGIFICSSQNTRSSHAVISPETVSLVACVVVARAAGPLGLKGQAWLKGTLAKALPSPQIWHGTGSHMPARRQGCDLSPAQVHITQKQAHMSYTMGD